jgi:hypothetical protein
MNSASAEIINLENFRSTRGADGVRDMPQVIVREIADVPPERRSDEVTFTKFYPLGDNPASRLAEPIRLLRESVERMEQAVGLCRENDAVGCDDCIQQVVALLPELFVWGQSIGDGFNAVVLATFHCLKNAGGPLSEGQLLELRSGLKKLSTAPYIHFEVALDIQEAYEGVGLKPDSKEVSKLSEFVEQGEGIR